MNVHPSLLGLDSSILLHLVDTIVETALNSLMEYVQK